MTTPTNPDAPYLYVEALRLPKNPFPEPEMEQMFREGCRVFELGGPTLIHFISQDTSHTHINYTVLSKGVQGGIFPQNPTPGQSATVGDAVYEFTRTASGGRWKKVSSASAKDIKAGGRPAPGVSPTAQSGKQPEAQTKPEQPKETLSPSDDYEKKLLEQLQNADFKKVAIKARLQEGRSITVRGQSIGGLTIHPQTMEDGSVTWAVTHNQSGERVVGGMPDEQNAKMTAMRLAQKFNFDRSADSMSKDPAYKDVGKFALKLRANPFARPPSAVEREAAGSPEQKDPKQRKTSQEVELDKETKKTKQAVGVA